MTQLERDAVDATRADGPLDRPAVQAGRVQVFVRVFVRRYGWRAYALPLLVVITVVALVSAAQSGKPAAGGAGGSARGGVASAPPTAEGTQSLKADVPGAGSLNAALPSDALPAGASYTLKGDGTYHVIAGSGPVVGSGTVHRYSIEYEGGIAGIDLTAFANTVQQVLSDPKSWTAGAGVALQRVDAGPVDFHVTLVSSITVRSLCGYQLPIETSCFAPAGSVPGNDVNRVVLNDSRWVRGDAAYVGDLAVYRIYMINHEDGHALGHLHAHGCLADGLAPVMMQQTIGLKATNGQLCEANPWPYPTGATDAPGAEAPDTPINNEFNLQNE
ncbi:MAG TPA: DUF3152 domain-containing protein [Jatrophihabitantaceae bacterium]|nr:DUF3152 domain-containing protein [Jatrophihabitantaceae bacterium]